MRMDLSKTFKRGDFMDQVTLIDETSSDLAQNKANAWLEKNQLRCTIKKISQSTCIGQHSMHFTIMIHYDDTPQVSIVIPIRQAEAVTHD
jgi:hypothetical protein